MSAYEDADGIDGPFERAMLKAMLEDRVKAIRRALWLDDYPKALRLFAGGDARKLRAAGLQLGVLDMTEPGRNEPGAGS